MGKREMRQVQVAVRFPAELLDRVDAFAEQLQAELEAAHPGLTASRADAVRVLVARGLEAVERCRTERPRRS